MGISFQDYYCMTETECFDAVTGYINRVNKEYLHTRLICWMIAAVNRNSNSKMPSPEKWWPLPADESYDNTPTEDRLKRLSDRVKQAQQMINQRSNGGRSQNTPRS